LEAIAPAVLFGYYVKKTTTAGRKMDRLEKIRKMRRCEREKIGSRGG
jgi:hypothetical protein